MTPARLGRLFDSIVLGALAIPAIAAACSSSEETPANAGGAAGNGGAAGADASISGDAEVGDACAPYVSDVEIVVFPDGNGTCHALHRHPCGLPEGVQLVDACVFNLNDCLSLCPISGGYDCFAYGDSCQDGSVVPGPATVSCDFCSTNVGRRPRGLVRKKPQPSDSPLGDYFARIAHLEAAAVVAFERLASDLSASGAPQSLLAAVSRAEKDERRHARMTRAIARRFGGKSRPVRVKPRTASSLEQIALENAVEGCVRETYGALVATFQSKRASDEKIARALRSIARDEIRHAALSWKISAWCEPLLSRSQRSRVDRAMLRARRVLEKELAEPHPELVSLAGVPNLAMQKKLLGALGTELWAG